MMSMATARTQQATTLGPSSCMKRERSRSGTYQSSHQQQQQQQQNNTNTTNQYRPQHGWKHGSSSPGNKKRRKLNYNKVLVVEKEEEFEPLDPTKPDEARRIQQRKRMVDKGKNTIGYSEYTRQVPKERRKPKSMEHPRTPDHKANIPNRRWLGMVSAWRVALHQYDPPDCVSDVTMRTKQTSEPPPKTKGVVIVAEEEDDDYLEDDVAQLEAGGGDDELDQLDTNNEFFLEEDEDDDDDLL
jgi:hypothetical protein